MATIYITRWPTAPMAGGRPWRIVLDKTTVAWIEPTGGDVTLHVEEGRHKLHLELSRLLRSATVSFKIRDGQTVNFSCMSKPYRLLLPPFWLFLGTWISLQQYDPTEEGAWGHG